MFSKEAGMIRVENVHIQPDPIFTAKLKNATARENLLFRTPQKSWGNGL